MGLFDSLFGKKVAPRETLPPIHGGDALAPHTAAVIECAAMSTANHLIDSFISERHGQKGRDWERKVEFFVNVSDIPAYTVRAISITVKTGSDRSYYFNVGRPIKASMKLTGMNEQLDQMLKSIEEAAPTEPHTSHGRGPYS